MPHLSRTAFLLIDSQQGFSDPKYWGPQRSNPKYEENVIRLLAAFRAQANPRPLIIHVQHHSLSPGSRLHPSDPGVAFYDFSKPESEEIVITKTVNSAFIGTNLEFLLRERRIQTLYIAGLSTDHCVSTTTRMADNLHVTWHDDENGNVVEGDVVLIADATACWKKPDGKWDAETVHSVHVESLREFARVATTEQVIKEIV